MRTSPRRLVSISVGLTAVIGLALGTTACGSDDTSSPDSTGAPSGSITVYTGRSEELIADLVAQFTADTGIEAALRAGDTGELAAQILTEGDASPADIFFAQDGGALGAVEQAGLFAALPDEVLGAVPSAYRSTTGVWVGTSGRVRVFLVNPTLVPDPPTTIDDLLDPQWKGKIGFAPTNASWQSFVTGLRVLRGDDGARAWLEAFRDLEPVPYEKNGALRDAVNAGEVAIGLTNHYYLYEKIAKEGADNVVAVNQYAAAGDPGGLVNVAGVGVLKSSDNAAAAQAFIAYLVGPKGQAYFAEKTFEYPLVAGTKISDALPPFDELAPPEIDLSDLSSIAATQELLADVGLLTL
jgi:iron(III) transport system substrate-binding protein